MDIQSIKPREHTPDAPDVVPGKGLRIAIVVGSLVALTAATVLVL